MSDDLEVRCGRCGSQLHHHCHAESLPEAAIDLYMWRPESGFPKALRKGNDWVDERVDDKTIPFFSEAFLYALVGKSDARSLLGLIEGLFHAMGIDPYLFQERAAQILDEKKRTAEEQEKNRAEARERYRQRMLPVVQVPAMGGRAECTYSSFYVFDVNVRSCERGACEALSSTDGTRRERSKPNMGTLKNTPKNGMSVECAVCKRIHRATPSQVEGWRTEQNYQVSERAKEREPTLKQEQLLNAECIAQAFGVKT